jgi:hypothetical protein
LLALYFQMKYVWPTIGFFAALAVIYYWMLLDEWKVETHIIETHIIQPIPVVVPLASVAAPVESAWPVINPPRPYLTSKVEEYMAHDKCTITKQRVRKDGVCETCMVCPDKGRNLAGWAATKCKSPTDCVFLETNVEWTRENTDPGWCEGVEDTK